MQTELLKQLHELQNRILESENRNQLLIKKQAILEENFKNLTVQQELSQIDGTNSHLPVKVNPSSLFSGIVFRQIFQDNREAMLIMSTEGIILDANKAACALLQYNSAEILTLQYAQIVNKDTREPAWWNQNLGPNTACKEVLTLIRSNGEPILTEINAQAYNDQSGEIKVLATIRDITSQQIALLGAEQNYWELFNKVNDAILIFDLNSAHILDANHQACKLYGYTLADFKTTNLKDLFEDVELGQKYLQQLRLAGNLEEIEVTHCRKDKSTFPLSWRVSFINYRNQKAVLAIIKDLTEQKKTEKILLDSEERFFAFMDNSPFLAWMKKADNWQYTYSNATHKRFLGLSREQLNGKTDFDLWLPDIATKLRQNDIDVVEAQQALEYQEEIDLPDGSKRQFLVQKFPFKPLTGESYVAGTCIDITDLLLVQQALVESETRNRAVLNTAMESIISINRKGEILEFNPAAEKTFGYRREEVIGKKLHDVIIPPRVRRGHDSGFHRFLQTGESNLMGRVLELTAMRANGEEFPVEVSITASIELNIPIFTGIIRDISERKAAEDALRRSEKQFRVITENMTDLVCLHEPDGKIIYISPSVQDILGFKPEELIHTSPYALIHPADKSRLITYVVEVLSGNPSVKNMEYRVQQKDGNYIWVDTGVRPIFNEAGKTVEVQTVSRNITTRKKTERKLKKAKKAAEISAMAKESFLANMSHEIRTPLNGILGMAGLLTKTALNDAQQKYLNIIDYSARNLLVIINDILDLAKIESGKLILEQIPFNIQELLQSTQQALEYKAEEKDILLIVKSFNLANPYVVGDPHRLTQVLLNLVSNAVKFTSQGVVVIRTDILEETATHFKFLITVKDTGIGIPKEKQELIFDNFTQADPHTSRNYGGTGLGLTICKNLIEMQGGRIWVESVPGQGSEFKFELAFQKAAPAQIEKVISDIEHIDYSSLGPLHILLAEDNEVNQFLAKSIMQNWGFTIDVAKNGKEAVTLATNRDYDLILMDIQMPEVSGTEATHLIRQLPNPQKANTPIIALTANALKGDAERFIAAGMNDYVAKPFDESKLFQKIAANLANSEVLSTKSINSLKEINTVTNFSNGTPIKVCDLTALQAMANGKSDFLIKFFELFIQQVPPQVQRMQEAAAQNNWSTVTGLAHQLKSNFDTLGVTTLQQPIRNLEDYSRQQSNLTAIPGLLATIKTISDQAILELQTEKARLQG
ncbi:PAS domain-containing hybrid sensor histidine kinase/response regulator [Adhaeribacter pallidiroseus]|uniref:Sensory/regulatory protein RpfC n=1 Tax=Adhaeribacter pallidiroseus TaxID=2072847 RepID=A0A369QJE4_9BACT|nr:PAS domain-containing hybrid sensor histidine kinase/response regulator [Adhaeribacter pallidiroseus]RDC62398.1 uncharacterized protein AHMF7616_00991 [Adhaeribacter pallidiroseus]